MPVDPLTPGRTMLMPLLRDDAVAGDVRRAVEQIEADARDSGEPSVEPGLRAAAQQALDLLTMNAKEYRDRYGDEASKRDGDLIEALTAALAASVEPRTSAQDEYTRREWDPRSKAFRGAAASVEPGTWEKAPLWGWHNDGDSCTGPGCINPEHDDPASVEPEVRGLPTYEARVLAMADALHEDCRLEWRAKAVVSPGVQVTQHGPDAHYGKAHDLVRRLPGLIGGDVWAALSAETPTPEPET